MTVCPVCEHQQEIGFECEVCGKDLSSLSGLGGLGPPPIAVQRIAELEITVPDRVGDVGAARVAELEANAYAKVEVAAELTPGLETSQLAKVGEVPVERVADLADDRVRDDGVRTAAPTGQVICRYCKNVQATGTVCDRCGMKLPTALRTEAAAPKLQTERCRACGAPGIIGERCKECGRVIAPQEG
jgi:hypothetical protein